MQELPAPVVTLPIRLEIWTLDWHEDDGIKHYMLKMRRVIKLVRSVRRVTGEAIDDAWDRVVAAWKSRNTLVSAWKSKATVVPEPLPRLKSLPKQLPKPLPQQVYEPVHVHVHVHIPARAYRYRTAWDDTGMHGRH